MNTTRSQDHAAKLEEFAQQSLSLAKQQPNNPWATIIAQNHVSAAEDARHTYIKERLEESGQVIDFRFFGARADGSIPLDSFIKIFDPISRALKSSAHKILTGSDEGKTAPIVGDYLNLKLAGISYGSTRVFISGSVAPDLTGSSLLQKTLEEFFILLNATNENFYESVDRIGGRSAKIFYEALSAIDSAGFGTEFSWQSPKGKQIWKGTPDEVTRLRTLLDGVQEPTVYEEELSGFVSKLFESGKIEIRIGDDRIPIAYPLSLIEQVQRLTISSPAKLLVLTSQYYDNVRKKDVFHRNLVSVLSD